MLKGKKVYCRYCDKETQHGLLDDGKNDSGCCEVCHVWNDAYSLLVKHKREIKKLKTALKEKDEKIRNLERVL